MALSGLVLVGFVIGHMLGNLKIFLPVDVESGAYPLDLYATHLREMGKDLLGEEVFLWIVRFVLLVAVILHAASGIALARLNRLAKPLIAQNVRYDSANAASRSMVFGGLFLIAFIVYHILHFTTGTVHFNGFEEGRVYANVVFGFQNKMVAGFYIVAMSFLALHLYHGTWSMFQTLGVTRPSWNEQLRKAAKILAIGLFLGFCALPVAVLLNLLPPPETTGAETTALNLNIYRSN